MFKNVLVGVDGRPTGRDAIALATRLLDPQGKLTFAHVHEDLQSPVHTVAPGVMKTEREVSLELLERERSETKVTAEIISLVSGSPGAALHQQAEEQQADLIVVGSCSRGAFGRAMLGDDTRAALNGAPSAVAVASRGYAEHPALLARLGVAYDESSESEAALALARTLTVPTNPVVQVLQVLPVATYNYFGAVPLGASVEELLTDANSRLKALPGVKARAVYGIAGEELATFSDQLDLLVVGSRGYGPLKRLVLGSTTAYLERHARCSLLVLPRAVTSPSKEPAVRPDTAQVGDA